MIQKESICKNILYRKGIPAIIGYAAAHIKYTTRASNAEKLGTKGLHAPMFGSPICLENSVIARIYTIIWIFTRIFCCKSSKSPPGDPRTAYISVQQLYRIPDRSIYGISFA
jgi:hypothetical protein